MTTPTQAVELLRTALKKAEYAIKGREHTGFIIEALAATATIEAPTEPRGRLSAEHPIWDQPVMKQSAQGDPMPSTAEVGERSEFEAWASADRYKFVALNRFKDGDYRHPGVHGDWIVWQARAALTAKPTQAGGAKAHGHREDYYLLANARRVALKPIHIIQTTPNWLFASELFATGSTSARQICRDAGIDPDGYEVVRAAASSGDAAKGVGQ